MNNGFIYSMQLRAGKLLKEKVLVKKQASNKYPITIPLDRTWSSNLTQQASPDFQSVIRYLLI